MTVKELRQLLADLPDDMEILIVQERDNGSLHIPNAAGQLWSRGLVDDEYYTATLNEDGDFLLVGLLEQF